MQCTKCNKEIKVGSTYCPWCGNQVQYMAKPEEKQAEIPMEPPVDRLLKKEKKGIIASLPYLFIPVVMAMIFVFAFYNESSKVVKGRKEVPAKMLNTVPGNNNPSSFGQSYSDKVLLQRVEAYYASLGYSNFDAAYWFSKSVDRYFGLRNVTPAAINNEYHNSYLLEFLKPQFTINYKTLKVGKYNDLLRLTYEGALTCYRKSRRKYEFARVRAVMILDDELRITSLYEEKVWDVRFTTARITE